MTSLRSDLSVLYHLALRPIRGRDHAQRMEDFYHGQAEHYDRFRERLLRGREELFRSVPVPEGGVWVDLGGGTGANLQWLDDRIQRLRKVYVVDLSTSLLEVACRRAQARGWHNVEAVRDDATTFRPAEGEVDVVTFSYALTMIPDWYAAVANAEAMLRPGGTIGVVDFYVSRKHTVDGVARHGWMTRAFWPLWFSIDNVFLSSDHLPFLQHRFKTIALRENRSKVPYVPFGRVPYYAFLGRKPARHDLTDNQPGINGSEMTD
jgi:S-adenosylmethionine-diacylgycerolhomoserine-N-methlytransferase